MNKNQKFLLLFIGLCMFLVLAVVTFNVFMPKKNIKADDIEVSRRSMKEEVQELPRQKPELKTKEYVNIYFVGKNEHGEEIYKAVKRQYSKDVDGSKIKFALQALVNGPKPEEKQKGVYSEIPHSAHVINISEYQDRVIVNMNSSFVNEGGADSLYKRLYQLIKTVNLNSDLPVYLYIDGHKADVLGGEGIMINQPLSSSSLEN
ncbi:GerMN domain-containing protein [bacterium]|nr:GerMN domain-containing protein [bacterium]